MILQIKTIFLKITTNLIKQVPLGNKIQKLYRPNNFKTTPMSISTTNTLRRKQGGAAVTQGHFSNLLHTLRCGRII